MAENQAADLMSFCASEFQQFFSHLGNSIHTYTNTGKVPGSAFKASGHAHTASAAKSDKPKAKRKPTAFNMFVKEKMEELKAAGVTLDGDKNNNGMFTLAVSSWKELSDTAKADFTNKFKVDPLSWLYTGCTFASLAVETLAVETQCRHSLSATTPPWACLVSLHVYHMGMSAPAYTNSD